MISPRSQGRLCAIAASFAVTVGLGGCVTLFPKLQPVQMYRFDVKSVEPAPQGASGASGFLVHRAPTNFNRGADRDQILTVSGDQAAYIAGARWISPAGALFDEAESHAFDQSSGPARLGRRGEVGDSALNLRLDDEAFEVRYLDGQGSAPTVVVQVRASLDRTADRKMVASQLFESRKKVEADRIGAIVPGFDDAVSDVLGQIVAWTNTQGTQALAERSAG